MCVGLEHSPTTSPLTTSIGALPFHTYSHATSHLPTYPKLQPHKHFQPRSPLNPRHHTLTQPHPPQTPTLSPIPAHTTHHTTHAVHTTQYMPAPPPPQNHSIYYPFSPPIPYTTLSAHPYPTPQATPTTSPIHTPQTIVYTTISSD